jgi:hypothetical protein
VNGPSSPSPFHSHRRIPVVLHLAVRLSPLSTPRPHSRLLLLAPSAPPLPRLDLAWIPRADSSRMMAWDGGCPGLSV